MAHTFGTPDQTEPSEAALKELNMPEYLRACSVQGITTILDATIVYEVRVGDWGVFYKTGAFGKAEAHRAAGAAFVYLAREQEECMHEWADKIRFAQPESYVCWNCGEGASRDKPHACDTNR